MTKQVVSNAGDCYRFETTVTAKDGLRSFSVGLRDNEETGVSYCFTVLCAQNRVIFEKYQIGLATDEQYWFGTPSASKRGWNISYSDHSR